MTTTRRDFMKLSGSAALAAGASAGLTGSIIAQAAGKETGGASSAPLAWVKHKAPLPKAKGQRVVVVGGGWSGLTIAKYVKKENPAFDVVLVEKSPVFLSCPLSNLYLVGAVNLEFLTHSYLDPARNNDYTYLQATVVGADFPGRKLYTSEGEIDYDYLCLSPGIDYDYASIGVTDPGEEYYLRQTYPAGFCLGSEHLSIKEKLDNFDKGIFLVTVPAGNYRCLPGPYERACLIADYFKNEKISGKVVVADANPDITIKKEGFHNAFDELYKGYIEYMPSFEIKSVDAHGRKIESDFDELTFDDATIYPRIRGSRLLEALGIVDPQSPQKEANIDPLHYNVIKQDRVFAAGDARPMPFSKSGNTSNSEGHHVARVIAARAQGKEIPWQSPHTVCYSAVAFEPLQAIGVDALYSYNPKDKSFAFAHVKLAEEWNKTLGQTDIEWAKGMYRDLFT
jgi:sulfide dehydrogenase [flavocytochrome c] flavoprotein subunit